jgi:hypothetical protein
MDDLTGIPEDEQASIREVVTMLTDGRPLPGPIYRGALRRALEADAWRGRPVRLRRLVLAYTASGALLLGCAGASALGVGPLGGPGKASASTSITAPT